MSNQHVDPVMRDILDALGYGAMNAADALRRSDIDAASQSAQAAVDRCRDEACLDARAASHGAPIQAAFAADRQMLTAYQARLQELEAKLYATHSALEVCRNERNRLRQFCDSFADWEQVLTGETEPTPIDQDVVIEALKVLRDRHLNEMEAIIEPMHRKWLAQFWSE